MATWLVRVGKVQFDHLVALADSEDRAKAIIEAMESMTKSEDIY